jgi:hypothetical protein
VRQRLTQDGAPAVATRGVSGEPYPESIKLNLLDLLLRTATLVPPDLRLTETGIDNEEP